MPEPLEVHEGEAIDAGVLKGHEQGIEVGDQPEDDELRDGNS